jgi:alpha-D-ribose 1-methylphosphonate 5-triphosphate synthase subunit PhnG
MEKKRLFRILARADAASVARLAKRLKEEHSATVVKEPNQTLTMIKLREPVKKSLFYLGEVMVCEAVVELDGTRGMAVAMGDDSEKTLNMAAIDAACNRGVFDGEPELLRMEAAQREREERENALHLKTMVSFHSMDSEVPQT